MQWFHQPRQADATDRVSRLAHDGEYRKPVTYLSVDELDEMPMEMKGLRTCDVLK